MTESNPENEVQDPAEPYQADKAVETQNQPEPVLVTPGQPADTGTETVVESEKVSESQTVTEKPAEGTGSE